MAFVGCFVVLAVVDSVAQLILGDALVVGAGELAVSAFRVICVFSKVQEGERQKANELVNEGLEKLLLFETIRDGYKNRR